ncbi:MAG: Gfo/Idh/MocA family oxidoreductase [Carboxylicivirga sp.]|jgi:predicted dehydrogenase|nr:Gfo/Idh/MocA family oxidoreductase [Carboxylicivirga sp.]
MKDNKHSQAEKTASKKQQADSMQRRDFLKKGLLGLTALTIVPRHVLGGPGYTAPSDQVTKGIIGMGGIGYGHHLTREGRLVAICDVDLNHLKRAINKVGKGVPAYTDFRDLLAQKDVDVVHIATPPHWHGTMAVMAAEAGKDIWCEKPMTRTIGEGIKVVEAVRKSGSMFRLNTWFRFKDNFYGLNSTVKPLKKAIDSGALGWPLKVTISGVTGYNWKFYWQGEHNLPPQPVPEHLDYNMWLGPAPARPYNSRRVHSKFRGYWDYDGGGLGDMGQHYIDPVQYILGKDDTSPVKVEVDAPQQHPDAVGTWRKITYTYADGCQIILDGENRDQDAAYIEGPKGKIYKGFRSTIPNLKTIIDSMPDPEPQITSFHESVRTRKKFALNEENGHRSCTIVNMGIVALRLGRTLHFDPVKQEFINDDGANRLLNQPMRGNWSI